MTASESLSQIAETTKLNTLSPLLVDGVASEKSSYQYRYIHTLRRPHSQSLSLARQAPKTLVSSCHHERSVTKRHSSILIIILMHLL